MGQPRSNDAEGREVDRSGDVQGSNDRLDDRLERPGQRGQSVAEYALIVTLIVIVALVALTFFGTQIQDILSIIADTING
jgi:Flp pilus assembly pilin Flp